MNRKRDRPYMPYCQDRPPFPKHRRTPSPQPADDEPVAKLPPPPALMVTGLPVGCSILDLKSRRRLCQLSVLWETDPLAKWREGVVYKGKRDNVHPPPSSSKLLRGELPLSRRGRGNKLASAIVNPRSSASDNSGEDNGDASSFDAPLKAREIVAYDDIL